MTEKAKRMWQRMKNGKQRDRILKEFNRSTLDDVGPLGGVKGEKFLSELNEMTDLEGDAGQKGPGG